MSDEEKKAIEEIKKDDEYYDILENIKQNKYNICNIEKLMRDTTNGSYTEYEIVQSIVYFVELIEKQSKEIEELKQFKKQVEEIESTNFIKYKNYISKDKIKAKIEENKWAIEHYNCDEADYKQSQAVGAWNVLQSFLEKE